MSERRTALALGGLLLVVFLVSLFLGRYPRLCWMPV